MMGLHKLEGVSRDGPQRSLRANVRHPLRGGDPVKIDSVRLSQAQVQDDSAAAVDGAAASAGKNCPNHCQPLEHPRMPRFCYGRGGRGPQRERHRAASHVSCRGLWFSPSQL